MWDLSGQSCVEFVKTAKKIRTEDNDIWPELSVTEGTKQAGQVQAWLM